MHLLPNVINDQEETESDHYTENNAHHYRHDDTCWETKQLYIIPID